MVNCCYVRWKSSTEGWFLISRILSRFVDAVALHGNVSANGSRANKRIDPLCSVMIPNSCSVAKSAAERLYSRGSLVSRLVLDNAGGDLAFLTVGLVFENPRNWPVAVPDAMRLAWVVCEINFTALNSRADLGSPEPNRH